MTTKPTNSPITRVVAVVCRAGNLTDALSESLRVEVHKQLAIVTEWDNPIGYQLTGRAL